MTWNSVRRVTPRDVATVFGNDPLVDFIPQPFNLDPVHHKPGASAMRRRITLQSTPSTHASFPRAFRPAVPPRFRLRRRGHGGILYRHPYETGRQPGDLSR